MPLRIPYTVWLVIVGLVIGLLPHPQAIELTPRLVLFVFLPPLLFAGGWSIDTGELAKNWALVTLLATLGVVLGIAISYMLLVFGAHLRSETALIFGALVAATDPVAVLALFRAMRINATVQTIVEGESLFNDGTAAVTFTVLLAALAHSRAGLDVPAALSYFALLTAGGVAVGAVVGYAVRLLFRVVARQLPLVAVLTAIAAYGAYFIADYLSVSGIMAVVFAAIVAAGSRSLSRLSDQDRAWVANFWAVVAFVANTGVFVLIGVSIHMADIAAIWPAALLGIAAVMLGRPLIVHLLAPVSALLGRPLKPSWKNAIALAGMRGALSMALALSLPVGYPDRALLVAMVFAVVLFTIVVQGALLEPLLRGMGLIGERTAQAAGRVP